MKKSCFRFLNILLILLLASPLRAQDLRNPQFVDRAQSGFKDIYNLDYEKARQVFASLEKEYPQNPAPPLYSACILWLEEMLRRQDLNLNRFIAPAYFSEKTSHVMPPHDRAAFFQALKRCENLATEILRKNKQDKDARYFLGTAYGLRSSFAITIDHSLREAFINGNKAYSYSRQLIQEDPNYYDAYLTVGIYEYIVGNIPWYLKWMAYVIGARGTKKDGFTHLKLASEKGQYIKNEAELVLAVLYVREHRYTEALGIARTLNKRFPKNFVFALNVAQTLKLAGNKDQALTDFIEVEKRAEAREPNFNKLPLYAFKFNLGTEFMVMGKHDLAQERFRSCIEDPQTPSREKTLSHLYLGKILDWKNQREEAAAEFKTVLSLENVENSHNQAKQLLKQLGR
jgi:hypothetical protein